MKISYIYPVRGYTFSSKLLGKERQTQKETHLNELFAIQEKANLEVDERLSK